MSRRLAPIALSLLSLLCPVVSPAQEQAPAAAAANPATPTAAEKKAQDLVNELADQVSTLHAPANRVRGHCVLANLLWSRDEKRARELFKSAADQIIKLIADLDYTDPQAYNDISTVNQLRQEIISSLGPRDAEMALTFLRQSRVGVGEISWNVANENNLEMQLAQMTVSQNPSLALKVIRGSLSKGISWNQINFLTGLQQTNAKEANALYREMVDRIKEEDLKNDQEQANSAWSLVTSFQPPQAPEDTYRDLLATVINAALLMTPDNRSSITLAQTINNQANVMMPQIEKYAPGRATDLKQWAQGLERYMDPNTRMYDELNKLSQNGTVDEILAAAAKYPPEYRNNAYNSAAWKAFSGGDPARARQIIQDYVPDRIQREQMLEQFENQAFYNSTDDNKLAAARRLVTRARTPARKIQVLTQIANMLASRENKKEAIQFLSEARTLIDSLPPSSARMAAQIELARTFVNLDPEQSFAILQPIIVKVNELIAAAAILDGYEARYMNDGEWIMPGANTLGGLVSSIDQTLATLSQKDFDRARALADQMERPEIRIMIELNIAQATVAGTIGNRSFVGNRRYVSLE